MSLFGLLHIFGRQKRLILAVTFAAIVLSAAVSLLQTPVYTATAKFLPPGPDPNLSSMMAGIERFSALAGGVLGVKSTSDTFAEMGRSQTVKDAIIRKFNLMKEYETTTRADTYRILDKRVAISVGKKDGIITLTVEDHSPVRAAELANAYVDEIGRLAGRLSSSGAGSDRRFAEKSLVAARDDLTRAEEALRSFQERNKAIHPVEQAKLSVRGIGELRAQLAAEEVRLAGLKEGLTESHPELKAVRASIANLRGQIGRLEGASAGSALPGVGTVPQLEQEYLRLLREMKIREVVVDVLTKQFELARIAEAKVSSPVQLIQEATPPDKRSKPKRRKMVTVSFAAGLLLSLAAAVLVDYARMMPEQDRCQWRALREAYLPARKG